MAGYSVVPQAVVDALAPALSGNPNQGAVMAEEICRGPSGALIQKLQAGEELTALERNELPPLRGGHTWEGIGMRIALADVPQEELFRAYLETRVIQPSAAAARKGKD